MVWLLLVWLLWVCWVLVVCWICDIICWCGCFCCVWIFVVGVCNMCGRWLVVVLWLFLCEFSFVFGWCWLWVIIIVCMWVLVLWLLLWNGIVCVLLVVGVVLWLDWFLWLGLCRCVVGRIVLWIMWWLEWYGMFWFRVLLLVVCFVVDLLMVFVVFEYYVF